MKSQEIKLLQFSMKWTYMSVPNFTGIHSQKTANINIMLALEEKLGNHQSL